MSLAKDIAQSVVILLLAVCLILLLAGCVPEENCRTTDKVDHYKTTETEFYTVTEPVYETVCD